jgi:hypothetical protein
MADHSAALLSPGRGRRRPWFSSNGTDEVLVMDPQTQKIRGDQGTLGPARSSADPTMALADLWLAGLRHTQPS